MTKKPTMRAKDLRFESARLRMIADENVRRSKAILEESKELHRGLESILNGRNGNGNGCKRGELERLLAQPARISP